MKKLFIIGNTISALILTSCGNHSNTPAVSADSVHSVNSGGPDSASNNGILPPSAAPGNAGNSSLADTTYKAKDTSKKK